MNAAEFDINKFGVVVKGLNTYDVSILKKILTEGLLPGNQQDPPSTVFTVVPGYISLSMVSWGGYATTSATWGYGAWEFGNSIYPLFTVIINPDYLLKNSQDFIAAGSDFRPGDRNRRSFEDKDGRLIHGLKYEEVSTENGELYPDEILAKYIAPEGIIGLIFPGRYIDKLRADLTREIPGHNLTIFDIQGNAYS